MCFETISNPRFRENEPRARRFRLQLFAQLIDGNTERFRFFAVLRSPNRLQQASMRQRRALVGNELTQQLKFPRYNMYLLPAGRDTAGFEVNAQVFGNKLWRLIPKGFTT